MGVVVSTGGVSGAVSTSEKVGDVTDGGVGLCNCRVAICIGKK